MTYNATSAPTVGSCDPRIYAEEAHARVSGAVQQLNADGSKREVILEASVRDSSKLDPFSLEPIYVSAAQRAGYLLKHRVRLSRLGYEHSLLLARSSERVANHDAVAKSEGDRLNPMQYPILI